jgi:hypothetical protein
MTNSASGQPATHHPAPRRGLWLLLLAVILVGVVGLVVFLIVYPGLPDGKEDSRQEARKALEGLGCKVMQTGGAVELEGFPREFSDDKVKALVAPGLKFDTVQLSLKGTRVTAAGLAELKPLTNLIALDLTGIPLTDASLANLEPLTRLKQLNLTDTGIGDDGLVHLKPLVKLERLFLEGDPKVTNKGLPLVVGLPELADLRLRRTTVDDQGLETLSAMKQLRALWVPTTVTQDAIDKLKEKLPELKVKH